MTKEEELKDIAERLRKLGEEANTINTLLTVKYACLAQKELCSAVGALHAAEQRVTKWVNDKDG